MARLDTAIDIENVDRSADQPRELLPVGNFLMELTAIEPKKDGNNISHAYTYEVIEPAEYAKRRVWDWIDLQNDLEWKAKKGLARIANLCDSIGYDPATEGRLEDDENIMYRTFMARVTQEPGGVSKAGKEFKPKNVVSRFYKQTDADAPDRASVDEMQPATPAATPAAANDNRRPAANDNARPAQAASAAPAGRRPWGSK